MEIKKPLLADKMASLFDAAEKTLSDLLAGIEDIGGRPPGDLNLNIALDIIRRYRYIRMEWGGEYLEVPIPLLDKEDVLLQVASNKYDVEVNTCLRFVDNLNQNMASQNCYILTLECNHPKCNMTKGISYQTPKDMINAEHRANMEIWYCAYHQQQAWDEDRALSEYLIEILYKVKQSPGINLTNIKAKRKDVEFLQNIGLLTIKTIPRNGKNIAYQHFLTDAGLQVVSNFTCDAM